MPRRDIVYAAIDSEIEYAVAKWESVALQNGLPYRADEEKSVEEWLDYIERYYDDMKMRTACNNRLSQLEFMRKLAGLCVRCMECCGAVKRGDEPIDQRKFPYDVDRFDVYCVIDGERDYQDSLGDDRTDGCLRTIGGYRILFGRYLRKAIDAWADNAGDLHALDEIRKLAAIAVRCLEEHGVDPRAPFNNREMVVHNAPYRRV